MESLVDRRSVPELAASDFSGAVAAITAAFGDSTRRRIYLYARERDGVTASEVAAAFALHPNVARHHLDKLAAGGYLDVGVDHPVAGAGRPSKRYRVPARALGLPVPGRREDLPLLLLGELLELVEPAAAEAVAERVGEDYGRSLAAQMSPGEAQRSVRVAAQAVADALTAHGFAARARPEGPSAAIVRQSCPFGDAALEHPVLCAVDRGLVRGLLSGLCGDRVEVRFSSRARGDATCTTVAG